MTIEQLNAALPSQIRVALKDLVEVVESALDAGLLLSVEGKRPEIQALRKAHEALALPLPMTDSLPKQRRWSFLRKHAVLKSLETGRVTEEEICKFHSISPEELAEWRTAFEARGLNGLKTTYRSRRH